jgi:hypothetical protein
MAPPRERTGTLILRLWVEGGRSDSLRVRILRTFGLRQATPLAVSTVDGVHTAVQAWLDELLLGSDG